MDSFYSLPQTIVKDRFPAWMFWSRTAQLVFNIVILGLDAAVISEWNKNDFSDLLHPTLETTVGDTSFTAFAMFTVILTLIVVAYDIIAPNWASNFYHVYTETVLEALLTIFWLVILAGVAAYLSGHGDISSFSVYVGWYGPNNASLAQNDKRSIACLTAATVLGSVMFLLCLANFVFLIVYSIRSRREKSQARKPGGLADAEIKVEQGTGLPMQPTS